MAQQESKKPNILVIWRDDIGQSNLSCFTKGMMGYRTPNIDESPGHGPAAAADDGSGINSMQQAVRTMRPSVTTGPAARQKFR